MGETIAASKRQAGRLPHKSHFFWRDGHLARPPTPQESFFLER